jgi:hypothetical protein
VIRHSHGAYAPLYALISIEHRASIPGIIGCTGEAHPTTQQLFADTISAATRGTG